jgi:hypothetical protein
MPETIPHHTLPAEAVRATRCRLCRRKPGKPCTRRGDHLGRWVGALRDGAISRTDLEAAFDALTVISWRCVVPGERAA